MTVIFLMTYIAASRQTQHKYRLKGDLNRQTDGMDLRNTEGHLQQAWLSPWQPSLSALQQLLVVPRDFKEMRTNAQKSAKMRYYARTDRSLIEKNLD
jgi:hypothetical protein